MVTTLSDAALRTLEGCLSSGRAETDGLLRFPGVPAGFGRLLGAILAWNRQEPPPGAVIEATVGAIHDLPVAAELQAMLFYFLLDRAPAPLLGGARLGELLDELTRCCITSRSPLFAILPFIAARTLSRRFGDLEQPQLHKGDHLQDTVLSPNPGSLGHIGQLAWTGLAAPLLRAARQRDPSSAIDEHSCINLALCGHIDAAVNRYQELSDPMPATTGFFRDLTPLIWFMHCVLSGILPDRAACQERLSANPTPSGAYRQDLADLVLLPHAGSDELRAVAHRIHRQKQLQTSLNFINYNPIRAALVLGDLDLARDCLQLRARNHIGIWLDHLFWARLHLADREAEKAVGHFHEALAGAAYFDAHPRLEFEMRLARELALIDLLALDLPKPPRRGQPATLTGDNGAVLVGDGPAMQELRQLVATYAGEHLPVLITGETGTGKDLVARALHVQGRPAGAPWVTLNCAAVNDNLLEAELFGHVRGGYTGAEADRAGLIAAAAEGTLFLDEIGDTSLRFQGALLRLLENGEYRPIGSDRLEPMRCRIVAATNARLDEAIATGRFRQDLAFRLRRLCIAVPPLREHREDVAVLAAHFLNRGAALRGRRLATDLADHLARQDWPGNVRQLRNVCEQLLVHFPERDVVGLADLATLQDRQEATPSLLPRARDGRLDRRERQERLATLFREHRQLTRPQIMRLLGISPGTASADLKVLIGEGVVDKIRPTPAPRTHYFVWIGDGS